MILAGQYSIPRDSGLVPGVYRVRIYWPEETGPEQGLDAEVPKERIPAKYNMNSDLSADIQPDRANVVNFALL